MAIVPTPRSYSQVLADLANAFLSRYGLIKGLKVGSPILATLESAAQSGVRSSQDIFSTLNVGSIDRTTGKALERDGADEGVPRISETASSGFVNIIDTSFTKIASRIYQGTTSPIVGSTSINVLDASAFPSTGSIYIGRNTINYEGPVVYTSITPNGTFFTLNLASGIQKFHNLNETVILARGGLRNIQAGTIVQTAAGTTSESVAFNVLYSAALPDGETEIDNVSIICQRNGIIGNVGASAINQFNSLPFTGASIINPLPIQNGLSVEDDDPYRERIKSARASRSKGTPLAIETNVIGIQSTDENKIITSANVVTRPGSPTTVYVDDGTGYEEKTLGIASETIVSNAIGGEPSFQLAHQPITKALDVSLSTAPFNIPVGSILSVKVGGFIYNHTFNAIDFKDITNASAYEITASINADSSIQFAARTANTGQNVVLFARTENNDSVEVIKANGTDANTVLNFPIGRVDTLRLYKNDRLLTKDGLTASGISNLQSTWGLLNSGETLILSVDNTSAITYTFTDLDFVNNFTGFNTLSRNNSLASWVTVLNAKCAGITATVQAGSIMLTSNAGTNSRASVSITGGTLTSPSKNVFSTGVSVGQSNDYVLDRNRAQISLTIPLSTNDKLTAGSTQTSAFIESGSFGTISPVNGNLWMVVDGRAKLVPTGITATTSVSFVSGTYQGSTTSTIIATGCFSNVQVGDWIIIYDPAINAANYGYFRVNQVTNDQLVINTTCTPQVVHLQNQGIVIVRTNSNAQVQNIPIPTLAGGYTASTLVPIINNTLLGASASVYRTSKLRVATNTNGTNGDIALVAFDSEGSKLLFNVTNAVASNSSHVATVETGNSDNATPAFLVRRATTGGSTITLNSATGLTSNSLLMGGFTFNGPTTQGGMWGNLHGKKFSLSSLSGSVATPRIVPPQGIQIFDGFHGSNGFAVTSNDTLNVLIDSDFSSKQFNIPFHRTLKTVGTTYASTNTFKDADNSNTSLVNAFGTTYDFTDYVISMKARANGLGILYRYYLYGSVGNNAVVRYTYPTTPSTNTAVTTDPLTNSTIDVSVVLPSGTARTINSNLRATTRIGLVGTIASPSTGPLVTNSTYLTGYAIATGSRDGSNNTTLTLTLPSTTTPVITKHGFLVGDTVFVNTNGNANFSSGAKTITAIANTTITYTEVAATIGSTAITGTVSFDSAGEVLLTGSGLAVNDIVTIDPSAVFLSSTGLDNTFTNSVNVSGISFTNVTGRVTVLGPQVFSVITKYNYTNGLQQMPTTTGVPTWRVLSNTNAIIGYPIDTTKNTTAQITGAVNALSNCPVTATTITGASISIASYDSSNTITFGYPLTDGINYVGSESVGSDYSFTFKDPINGSLSTNSDWANEQPRLIPVTASGIARWLNTPTVCGLFSTSTVVTSTRNGKIQISSNTLGSTSSVQIQGGTSNSLSSVIVGSGQAAIFSNQVIVQIPIEDSVNYLNSSWVSLQNSAGALRVNAINSLSQINSIDNLGNFVFAGGISGDAPFWIFAGSFSAPVTASFNYEKQSKYLLIAGSRESSPINLTGVLAGDYVTISSTAFPQNSGIFRIVAIDVGVSGNGGGIWIENLSASEAIDDTATLTFTSGSFAQVGDQLVINSDVFGAGNRGIWTIKSIDFSTTATSNITVDISQRTTVPFITPLDGLFSDFLPSTDSVFVRESTGSKLIKQIVGISPNVSPLFADIKLSPGSYSNNLSAGLGTVMASLDKLSFPTSITSGVDAYNYSVGLIGQANTVLYGSSSDPVTYPGVVSANGNVNISGPLVRRVIVSLAIRISSGNKQDISDAIKSNVASVINSTDIGESIPISDIISAAGHISGVAAVSIISPGYSSSSDRISIQPYEKALVLNLDTDILLSFIGDF